MYVLVLHIYTYSHVVTTNMILNYKSSYYEFLYIAIACMYVYYKLVLS